MNNRRYCLIMLLSTGGLLSLVAAFNILVDPLGAYPAWHLKVFDRQRDSQFSRLARGEQARLGDCDMAIFGTSRPKAGLPASHPAYGTNRMRNFAVDAGSMIEAADMLDYVLIHNPVQRVVLCLDLVMFRQHLLKRFGFDDSRFNSELPLFDYQCKNILGAGATGDSCHFVVDRLRHKLPPPEQRRGFYVHQLKPASTQRVLFEKTLRAHANGIATLRVHPGQMQALRHFLAVSRDRQIDLTIAINPVHAMDLELLQVGENLDQFEQWERNLVQMISEEAPTGRVPVWDFSGYVGPPAEQIPPAGDLTRMKFYFESSHFTLFTGGLMLDRMFGGATSDFGKRISTNNIEAHLQTTRVEREAFVARFPADIEWAHGVAKKALEGRRLESDAGEDE